jgi:type I restriction enzyme S subunit
VFYKQTDFKETSIGEVPRDWELVRLGEILEEIDLRVRDLENAEKMQVLSLTRNYGLVTQAQRFEKRVATKDVNDYKIVRQGWLVYNPYVIWEGAIHFLKNTEPGIVSPAYVTWKPTTEADYLFLDYLIRTRKMLKEFFRLSAGVVQRRRAIKKEHFSKIQISLPPIQEQRKIVEVLSFIDLAIAKIVEVIAKTERLKKGLMQELLTKGIGHKEYKQTQTGTIPKEWEVVKLQDSLDLCQYGLSIPLKNEGEYPIVRMDELVNGYVTSEITKFVDLDKETFEAFRLEKGDILFNRTNSYELVGRTGIFLHEGNYVFASYLIRLRPKRDMFAPHFLKFYLIFSRDKLRLMATRAVHQANINATNLQKFKVPKPPLEEQQKIASILQTIDKKLELEKQEKTKLEKTIQGLMDLLLTGKVRVKVD